MALSVRCIAQGKDARLIRLLDSLNRPVFINSAIRNHLFRSRHITIIIIHLIFVSKRSTDTCISEVSTELHTTLLHVPYLRVMRISTNQ